MLTDRVGYWDAADSSERRKRWRPTAGTGKAGAMLTEPEAAGDVYLCHPFLVHRASWPHRGRTARIIAQPSVWLKAPYALIDPPAAFPVEQAILRGLGGPLSTRTVE